MDIVLARTLFGEALDELQRDADMTNQVLEVSFDEADASVEVLRYEFPR